MKVPNKLILSDAFVVTKPLQYLNVLNIENVQYKTLLLIDCFANAKTVFKEIREKSDYWDYLYFFDDMADAFNWLLLNKSKIGTLYIDSDINHKRHFFNLRKLNITVYEEGLGTYRKSQYKPRRWFIGNCYLFFMRLLGYENRRGGNKYTKNIIVYNPRFYNFYISRQKKRVNNFKLPLLEHIVSSNEINVFNDTFNYSKFHEKTILLYIASWDIENIADYTKQLTVDYKFIKPHPHTNKNSMNGDFDVTISSTIPAEIFITNLIQYCKKLYIVSNYSSSVVYFVNNDKVDIINMPLKSLPHNDDSSYLDAYFSFIKYI